jgi:hypothetical protein
MCVMDFTLPSPSSFGLRVSRFELELGTLNSELETVMYPRLEVRFCGRSTVNNSGQEAC